MPIDPAVPPAIDPAAALAQRLADFDQRLRALERGGSSMAGYAEDLTTIQPGIGTFSNLGPEVKLRVGPAGGFIFAYGQMNMGGDAANDVQAWPSAWDDPGTTLLQQAAPMQARSGPGLTAVASYPGVSNVAGATGVPLGFGGPVCLGYFAAGRYTVRFQYHTLTNLHQYNNRRLAAWTT